MDPPPRHTARLKQIRSALTVLKWGLGRAPPTASSDGSVTRNFSGPATMVGPGWGPDGAGFRRPRVLAAMCSPARLEASAGPGRAVHDPSGQGPRPRRPTSTRVVMGDARQSAEIITRPTEATELCQAMPAWKSGILQTTKSSCQLV